MEFRALSIFDKSILNRYKTLERNIKSKSNSFYDSYLDLLEDTIKVILELENVDYEVNATCGKILRESKIETFFIETLKVSNYTFEKFKDYTGKINKHKHFDEKNVGIESIVAYMRVYYDLVKCYSQYKGKVVDEEFDAEYFSNIFGLTIRENSELKNEVSRLKDDLNDLVLEKKISDEDIAIYKNLLDISSLAKLTLEEQNTELRNQLNKLKDIKLNALEDKLNKALELLVNLNGEILENRLATAVVYKSITGGDIKNKIEELKEKNHE